MIDRLIFLVGEMNPLATTVLIILLLISLMCTIVVLAASRYRFEKIADEWENDIEIARKMLEEAASDMNTITIVSGKIMTLLETFAEFSTSPASPVSLINNIDETKIILNQLFHNLPGDVKRQLPKMKIFVGPKSKARKDSTGGGGDYFDG